MEEVKLEQVSKIPVAPRPNPSSCESIGSSGNINPAYVSEKKCPVLKRVSSHEALGIAEGVSPTATGSEVGKGEVLIEIFSRVTKGQTHGRITAFTVP
jgi:hypothetical protein